MVFIQGEVDIKQYPVAGELQLFNHFLGEMASKFGGFYFSFFKVICRRDCVTSI